MSDRRAETRHQGGVALITALLIVALLTALVSRLALDGTVWRRQVENGAALAQAMQATRAAQRWVASVLDQDTNGLDALTDDWAQPLPPIDVAWGELTGWVEDMQGRFNLNNLVDDEGRMDPQALQGFERLLTLLELDPAIAMAVVDWIDPDAATSGLSGAEDLYYLSLPDPYPAANRPFEDVEELLQVRGIDREVFARLVPHVAALPGRVTININTATPVVIAATLNRDLTPAQALERGDLWVTRVVTEPYERVDELLEEEVDGLDSAQLENYSVTSAYFLARTRLDFGRVAHVMATLYQRQAGRSTILRQNRLYQ